jgi:hypothetical protein
MIVNQNYLRQFSLAVGEAISHSVRGIAAGVDGEDSFQFVVAGSVQEITDRNYAGHSSSEENQLASGSALAERLCHRIQFPSSVAQVPVGNAKVHCFESGVAGEKHLVGCVPKIVFSWNSRQILGANRSRNRKCQD